MEANASAPPHRHPLEVGANVNRLKGRMKYLETMTGMSTISLSLYGEERAVPEGFINWSLVGHGFWRAARERPVRGGRRPAALPGPSRAPGKPGQTASRRA